MSDLIRRLFYLSASHRVFPIVMSLLVFALKIVIINSPHPELPADRCLNPSDGSFPPGCGFVFDEAHYVPAARKLLMGQPVNNEHPPLSKFLIVLGILVFGDNPLGWRFFSVLTSSASVALIALIAWELTRSRVVLLASTLLFAFDVMSFNLGSIAVLDPPAMAFTLAGTVAFLRERYMTASALLSLAFLSKTASLFAVAGLLFYRLVVDYVRGRDLRAAINEWLGLVGKVALVGIAVSMAGLAAYDYSYHAFSSPFAHLDYMLSYHTQLRFNCSEFNLPFSCVVKEFTSSTEVRTVVDLPLSWAIPMFSFQPAGYYVVAVSDGANEWHPVAYWGIYSPLWWTTWVAVGSSLYTFIKRASIGADIRVEAFVLSWVIFNYGAFFILGYALTRWVYAFYFYAAIPGLTVGIAHLLREEGFPKLILYILIAAQIMWFFIFFPVKSEWHIAVLRLLNLPR